LYAKVIMTADTNPRWLYHVPTDTAEARQRAAALYFDRFAKDPSCSPHVVQTKMGVTLCYPLPGDTFDATEFEVVEVPPGEGVQLDMFG